MLKNVAGSPPSVKAGAWTDSGRTGGMRDWRSTWAKEGEAAVVGCDPARTAEGNAREPPPGTVGRARPDHGDLAGREAGGGIEGAPGRGRPEEGRTGGGAAPRVGAPGRRPPLPPGAGPSKGWETPTVGGGETPGVQGAPQDGWGPPEGEELGTAPGALARPWQGADEGTNTAPPGPWIPAKEVEPPGGEVQTRVRGGRAPSRGAQGGGAASGKNRVPFSPAVPSKEAGVGPRRGEAKDVAGGNTNGRSSSTPEDPAKSPVDGSVHAWPYTCPSAVGWESLEPAGGGEKGAHASNAGETPANGKPVATTALPEDELGGGRRWPAGSGETGPPQTPAP